MNDLLKSVRSRLEPQPPCPWTRPLRRFLWEWRRRHRNPFNFVIHLIGIPLAFLGVYWLFALPWEEWYWGAGAFVVGYVLQFIGHYVEGNDLGEWAAIKRLLGLPYVSVAPQLRQTPLEESAPPNQFPMS